MKSAVIVISASGRAHDVSIEPGTTPRDVLSELGLGEDYVLSKDGGAHTFGDSENLYPEIVDGEKLSVTCRTDVGCDDGHLGLVSTSH